MNRIAAPQTRDYFAEMYVAGVLADAGWNIYFPRRDQGFDFIITKLVGQEMLVRPVQVKGKYPQAGKTDKATFGYAGRMTQLHPDMVLAIPFFSSDGSPAPKFTAYLPRGQIRQRQNDPELYFAFPAYFASGEPGMRRDYGKFFDHRGVALLEAASWAGEQPEDPGADE